MLRVTKRKNFLMISPNRTSVAGQAPMESIPLVMEPQSSFYSDPVVVLDFQVSSWAYKHFRAAPIFDILCLCMYWQSAVAAAVVVSVSISRDWLQPMLLDIFGAAKRRVAS